MDAVIVEVILPAEIAAELRDVSRARGLSQSAFTRQAILNELTRSKNEK